MDSIFFKYAASKHVIGIGTGRTMHDLSQYLAHDKTYICSSTQSMIFLDKFSKSDIMNHSKVDIYFDSADYYDEEGNLVKGGGGAMTQERLLMDMAGNTIIIVQKSKKIINFKNIPIPVEIIKPSLGYIQNVLDDKGLKHQLR